MDVYIYYTMEKVSFEILNTVGLKTWNSSENLPLPIDSWRPTIVNLISYCVY